MIFYDTESAAAVLTGVTIAETVGFVVTKQLSGVYYYTTSSRFTVDIADIDNLNQESYPLTQVTISGTEYALPQLSLAGADLTAWTNAYNNTNASYNKTDWEINAANFCSVNLTGNISARTEDWASSSWVNSANAAILVDTYTNNATRIYEDFRTENRRRTSLFAAWNSAGDLTAYDDNAGLQVQCSRIVYPALNYGLYSPLSGSQPDYSAVGGSRTFFWSVYHNGTSHANGRFVLGDHNITEADITADNLIIEISLDNVNWWNCNEDFLGGSLNNGDGCRVDPGIYNLTANNTIAFTFGVGRFTDGTTGPADEGNWGLYVRLTWSAAISAKYIGSIQESTWV